MHMLAIPSWMEDFKSSNLLSFTIDLDNFQHIPVPSTYLKVTMLERSSQHIEFIWNHRSLMAAVQVLSIILQILKHEMRHYSCSGQDGLLKASTPRCPLWQPGDWWWLGLPVSPVQGNPDSNNFRHQNTSSNCCKNVTHPIVSGSFQCTDLSRLPLVLGGWLGHWSLFIAVINTLILAVLWKCFSYYRPGIHLHLI